MIQTFKIALRGKDLISWNTLSVNFASTFRSNNRLPCQRSMPRQHFGSIESSHIIGHRYIIDPIGCYHVIGQCHIIGQCNVIKIINLMKHNNNRVREDRANTMIFM